MSEINVLEQSIFNRIAAGEVVERPASIVKELVENSIDAGASLISIDVKNGGTYICISDNGKGMDEKDLSLAFMPHATSKISNVSDLENISTLGFRGEAIPSIASISNMKITSRQADSPLGVSISCNFGKLNSPEKCGAPQGTTVIVNNVFDNVPARKKFLQKDSTEEAQITNIVSKIILANYNISIKYTVNGKNIFQSTGQDMQSAIYTIYGKEFVENLQNISTTMSDITIEGYVGKPHFTKHSKNFQTLIVNGRYVINNDISFYVYECYQNYLMKRQYPCYIIYLNIPYDLVDVNVHPSKLEVKFVNPKIIRTLLHNVINDTVINLARIPKNISEDFSSYTRDDNNINSKPFSSDSEEVSIDYTKLDDSIKITNTQLKDYSKYYDINLQNNTMTKKQLPNNYPQKEDDAINVVKIISNYSKDQNELHENSEITNKILNNIVNKKVENIEHIDNNPILEQSSLDSFLNTPNKYVGKLFNTYLMVESGDNVYCIDQHAAHEKLLYDKFVEHYNSHSLVVQDMLVPYTFNVSNVEKIQLDEHLDEIAQLGFNISYYGGLTYSLKSIPAICSGMNINDFLNNLLQNLTNKNLNRILPFKDIVMQMSCKAAIKGEMDISQDEIDLLLNQMKEENITLFCPHGRPIVVVITREEIEKWFKRIV